MTDLDWTKDKENGCFSTEYGKRIYDYLKKNRIVMNGTYYDYRDEEIKNKRVLDIGVCEHNIEHVDSADWKHDAISRLASYCVGVDIDKKLVDYLNQKGYNIKLADATSEEFLGEKFDIVLIGDVLEHVDNPRKLLEFAKRHLNEDGKIIATTPNPFFIVFFFTNFLKSPFMALLEHTCWITPTNAVELARRSGLAFHRYLFFKKSKFKGFKFSMQTILKMFLPCESVNSYYVYEFTLKQ